MENILIGYDASPEAERALARAGELGKAFGAHVVVFSVAPAIAPAGRGMGAIDPTDTPAEHAAQVERAVRRLAEYGLTAEPVTGVGHPAKAIADAVEERGIDLVVVGSRDLGAVERLLGGSVSDAVAHRAACDVLIVR